MTDPRPQVQTQALKTQKKKRKPADVLRGLTDCDRDLLAALVTETGMPLRRSRNTWYAGTFRLRPEPGVGWVVSEIGKHGSCASFDAEELAEWMWDRLIEKKRLQLDERLER